MHPNPAFRQETADRNAAFARERGFGTLAVAHDGAPLVSHVPFLLSEDGAKAELHLVRSNPICKALPAAARIAVTGPDSYISPDWYGVPDQVPTWNYVAVHITGRLEPLPQDAMHDLLDRQSAHFEERLSPKTPWTSEKMTPGVMERMMRQILPFVLHVEDISGTWKLNQNKDVAVRLRAADHVAAYGQGQELSFLAALMRGA
ncbi:FMN-binding negative transcriptional regulator [Roseobacteraceae bacterium S113]